MSIDWAWRLVIGPDLYSFRALWRRYRSCRRNKRTTANALAFELNAEANLLGLHEELRARAYRPGRSICPVGRVLGLHPVYLPRAGYGFAVGFPRRFAYEYARRAMQSGMAVVLIGAGVGTVREGPRRRWATRLLVAQQAPH